MKFQFSKYIINSNSACNKPHKQHTVSRIRIEREKECRYIDIVSLFNTSIAAIKMLMLINGPMINVNVIFRRCIARMCNMYLILKSMQMMALR